MSRSLADLMKSPQLQPMASHDWTGWVPPLQPMQPMASHVQPSQWDKRPDGSQKGNGYLGILQRPDGTVMTEYSIADSEDPRLRGPKGEYLDYPTLVPTLTAAEVNTLINLPEGAPVPDSIKQKAEAHALARIAKGEPIFAQPGEQNVAIHPHVKRVR